MHTTHDRPPHTRQKGRAGEDQAVEHLLGLGYTLLTRNFQTRAGEIDCVAQDPSGVVVFVEVKSAGPWAIGHPLFWVTRAKQRTMARVAQQYRAEHSLHGRPCRFDVIAIKGGKIDHLKNAFLVG